MPSFFNSYFSFSLIYRSVGSACTIVGTFFVHAECVPCGRTEDVLVGDVVHADGYAQDGAKGDEVGTDVADKDIFRPAAWNAFGMDKEGADYRACQTFGPIYK